MILDFLVDFIFPKLCVVCGREGNFLCRWCKERLPVALQICPMCTRPSVYGLTHEFCRKRGGLDGLVAVFDYQDKAVRRVVEAIKFGFNRDLVRLVMAGWRAPRQLGKAVLVPIPLHRYRENWRGFNQAELIAKVIAGKKVSLVRALRRTRATSQQARAMGKKARRDNVKGAFVVESDEVAGKRILLVDDVFTSGATMKECARQLKRAGAVEVWGFVLAR